MAREIIQMYDKYHSTKKVYPKVIEECLPEDYQGLPEAIEDIPTVVANPELAGTEGDLESLQVGDTKYKIGGGKQLYLHTVYVSRTNGDYTACEGWLSIITDNNTPFTYATLVQYLETKNFTGNVNYPMCGYFNAGANIESIFGVSIDSSHKLYIQCVKVNASTGTGTERHTLNSSYYGVSDGRIISL